MRKLAIVAISFSMAVYAANYILEFERLSVIAVALTAISMAFLLLRKRTLQFIAAVLLAFAAGLFCFHIHANATVMEAEKLDGRILKVNAEVLDYPEVYNDYCRLEVRIKSYYLPELKAYLYDNDMKLSNALPGDSISLKAKVSAANSIYGEESDSYYSKGIYLKLTPKSDITLEQGGFDIFMLPKYVSHWLSSRIEEIFPEDTEVFMRSLMLGDKTDFYGNEALHASMSRAGLMHIVAVSGLHVSYLVGLTHDILGRGKRSALVCIAMVWFFALVTGAGPSILRASFMHSLLLMAPVLKRENDPITSLSVILALILMANPYAASSIALQLSFSAMAGIVLFADSFKRAIGNVLGNAMEISLVRKTVSSIACSLSVLVLSMPLTALHFGTITILAPVTNLLSLWAVSACFSLGWISCALSVIPVAGIISAELCSLLARYIFLVSELISSVPFAVVYTETEYSWIWLIVSYILFAIMLALRAGVFASIFATGVVSAALLAAILVSANRFYAENETISVLDVGQGQCVAVLTDEATVVLDCGNINTIHDAGTEAASYLYSRGRSSVDCLVLSHLHADHANGAAMLMELMEVETLVLPAESDDSDYLREKIIYAALRNGTKIKEVKRDTSLDYGDIELELYKLGHGEEENERCIISKVEINDFEFLALADADYKIEQKLAENCNLETVDAFMVSHHGSRYSSCDELLSALGGKTAIISVGTNYFGHPADETLEALKSYGYNIYRTDELGDIELRTGKNYGKKIWKN